ncbi:hypothetical protein SK128_003248, partial [Halocaridina rubra]
AAAAAAAAAAASQPSEQVSAATNRRNLDNDAAFKIPHMQVNVEVTARFFSPEIT